MIDYMAEKGLIRSREFAAVAAVSYDAPLLLFCLVLLARLLYDTWIPALCTLIVFESSVLCGRHIVIQHAKRQNFELVPF